MDTDGAWLYPWTQHDIVQPPVVLYLTSETSCLSLTMGLGLNTGSLPLSSQLTLYGAFGHRVAWKQFSSPPASSVSLPERETSLAGDTRDGGRLPLNR